MKALKSKSYPDKWGLIKLSGIHLSDIPTILNDSVSISDIILWYGFKAVEDYVLVNVKIEQI